MQANAQLEDAAAYGSAKNRARGQWLATGLGLAILGCALGINLYMDYGSTAARERDRLSTQARIIAQNMELQLATANRALEGLLGELSVWKDEYDRQTHIEYIRAIANAMPGIRTMGIVDADGTLLASSQMENVGSDLSGLDYFLTPKQQPDSQTLFISRPYRNVLGPNAINISRVALGPQGEFQGIVYASLNTDYFQTLMGSVLYAPDMWDAAAHADGVMFLSVPMRERLIGMDLRQPGSFFSRHRDSGMSTTVLTGTELIGGDPQIVAQHTVQPAGLNMDKPLIIAVGRDLTAVFHPWKHAALLQSALYALISLVTVLGLYLYQRRQREFDRKETAVHTALRASEENYRLIVENTKDVVVKLDAEGRYTYINPAFSKLYGVAPDALPGKYHWHNVIPEDRDLAHEFFGQLFHAPYTASVSLRENTAEGVRHLQWTGQALPDGKGQVAGIISIGRDITQQIKRMTTLEEQAQRDHLTGLANRRHFMDLGDSELARVRRYERPLSLLAIDLDHFKTINDTHGHQAGDIVLQKFSAILKGILRDADIAGRLGGEEFAILLPETGLAAARDVAQRLHAAIAASEVTLKHGAKVNFTVSIGVAILPDHIATLSAFLDYADTALYQAKRSGRNRVCVADMPRTPA